MKSNTFFIFFILILFYIQSIEINENNDVTIMNLYYSEKNNNFTTEISNKADQNALACAIYNKSYEKIGWDYLTISTYEKKDNKYNDSIKAYGMGYLEGILTKDRIYSHYQNFYNYFLYEYNQQNPQILTHFFDFFLQNIEYMKDKSLENMDKDPYWEHVYYIYQQILGLHEGYNSVTDVDKKLKLEHILLLLGTSDAEDVKDYLFRNMRPNFEEMSPEEFERYSLLNTHCSAFVKLAKDWNDIWFGHNTWNYYVLMIRIFKEYRFVTNKGNEKSQTSVFSSYPAALSSIDEFYYLDSNLLVMGTSNSIYNNSLYDLITYKSLLIWVRQIVANRLASSAEEWTEIFQKENSGTNNEQAIILDINKIDFKNKKLNDKALMIIEQIPKYTETADVTEYLRKGYWPSYNVPFLDTIYKESQYKVEINEKGESENIEYTRKERAKIFKRDQDKVNSLNAFKDFMRYNDYKNDNLSENNPSKTIAARSDLKTNGKSCHGAIDAKFVSIKELLDKKNIIHIISGPSNEQQPTFNWSNTTCISNPDIMSHIGQNEVWNFPWIDYDVQLFNKNSNENPSDDETDNSFIYYIIFGAIFIIVVAVIIFVVRHNKKQYDKLEKDINKISFQEGETNNTQEINLLIN